MPDYASYVLEQLNTWFSLALLLAVFIVFCFSKYTRAKPWILASIGIQILASLVFAILNILIRKNVLNFNATSNLYDILQGFSFCTNILSKIFLLLFAIAHLKPPQTSPGFPVNIPYAAPETPLESPSK